MLRTVSSIPMSSSSPSKKEAAKTDQDEKAKTFLFNLSKVVPNESKKRKKEKEDLSSDDDDDADDSYEDNVNDNETEMPEDDDEAEKQLENLVFGSDAFLVDNMDKIQGKKAGKEKKTEIAAFFEKKAAWQDENDEEM